MKSGYPFLVVMLLTGTVLDGVPLPVRVRFMRRRRRAVSWFTAWLIRTLSESDVSHCAIAIGEVVYDPCMVGDRLWALDVFLRRFPTITDLFIVPGSASFPPSRPRLKAWWPSLIRWMSRGKTRADDCVTCTVAVLRRAGHTVPDDVITPDDLRSWCRSQGFQHERIAPG